MKKKKCYTKFQGIFEVFNIDRRADKYERQFAAEVSNISGGLGDLVKTVQEK